MSNDATPSWTVREKVKSFSERDGTTGGRVTAELLCNGRVVHELSGARAVKSLQEYADLLNKKKAPEPPKPIKVGADGGRLPDTIS